jgi:hypothetical protein
MIKDFTDSWLDKKVILKTDIELINANSIGVCTADLQSDDVFAVYFNDTFQNDKHWVTFNYKMKELFEVIDV